MIEPRWTVNYNIVSPESDHWVGTGWEFFDEEAQATLCFERHSNAGNCPTKRPYYRASDWDHLGAADRFWMEREMKNTEAPCGCKPPAHDPSNRYFACPHGQRGPEGVQGVRHTAER
jgi:hypothetical protein